MSNQDLQALYSTAKQDKNSQPDQIMWIVIIYRITLNSITLKTLFNWHKQYSESECFITVSMQCGKKSCLEAFCW